MTGKPTGEGAGDGSMGTIFAGTTRAATQPPKRARSLGGHPCLEQMNSIYCGPGEPSAVF